MYCYFNNLDDKLFQKTIRSPRIASNQATFIRNIKIEKFFQNNF